MSSTNIVKKRLETVFGAAVPKTATNFFTANGNAVFEGGRVVGLRPIKMTQEQEAKLKELGLFGASGWSLV